jgi:hypothetical protein
MGTHTTQQHERGFLRDTLHPPRAAQFMAAHPGNLDPVLLQQFIATVWADLVERLATPIRVEDADTERRVWFIDTVCYRLDKRTGVFALDTRARDGSLETADYQVAVDPPLATTGGWLEAYLLRCRDTMNAVLIHQAMPGVNWHYTVRRLFWAAVRRSTWWKRIRHAARNALALDAQVLDWCRRGRPKEGNRHVSNTVFNRSVRLRDNYAQLQQDNPRLMWLYTFMLDEKVALPSGDAITAMRGWLAERKLSPAAWRLLANGREKDFRLVRDWIDPNGALTQRRAELVHWLRFFAALRRKTPLPPAVAKLFMHDHYRAAHQGFMLFRNLMLDVAVLKTILAEAERRLAAGTFSAFMQQDLIDIMVWLEAADPVFDANQRKAGWDQLAARAAQWRSESAEATLLQPLRWPSLLGETQIGDWTVAPLADAWSLRQEAMRQHHCVDSYHPLCLEGSVRVFSVRNSKGRRAATLVIEYEDGTWTAQGIRAACNKPVGPGMDGLAEEVARRYTALWRMEAQPEQASATTEPERTDYVAELLRDLG